MESTANEFIKCLQKWKKPHMITVDNGSEFIGKQFTDVAHQYKIKFHRIHVREPEENGKVERFWQTLDSSLKHKDQLEEF